jgi:hypothetical protein
MSGKTSRRQRTDRRRLAWCQRAPVGGNLLLVGCLVLWARRGSIRLPGRRDHGRPGGKNAGPKLGSAQAAVLAVAAGSAFGLTAALMKAMTRTLSSGVAGLLTGWPVYAMVAAGVLGMLLTQSALNAGQLIAAQPGLTLSDPLISVLRGVLVFHEQVRQGWYILGAASAAVVIVAGLIMLARSPLLADDDEADDPAGDTAADRPRRQDHMASESPADPLTR